MKRALLMVLMLAGWTLAFGQQGGGFGGGGLSNDPSGRLTARAGMDVFRHSGILTATEDAPYPVKMDAGDGLIVKVTSNEFDTSVVVTDKDGKVLKENDDEEPGSQNSTVVIQFPEAGDYKVVVKGFQGKSGGRYDIEMSRFRTVDATFGADFRFGRKADLVYVRVPMKRGEMAAVRFRDFASPSTVWVQPDGTDGEVLSDSRDLEGRPVTYFQASKDGDYYLGTQVPMDREAVLWAAKVERQTLRPGDRVVADGPTGAVWAMVEGKAGQLLRIKADSGESGRLLVQNEWITPLGAAATEDGIRFEREGEREIPASLEVPLAWKSPNDTALLFRKDGSVPVMVFRRHGPVALTVEDMMRPMAAGSPVAQSLAVGSTDYYATDIDAGRWLEVTLDSEVFDADLSVLGPMGTGQGDSSKRFGDGAEQLRFWVGEKTRFYFRVGSPGGGGGGAYRLQTRVVLPTDYPASGELRHDFGAETRSEVWNFPLTEGERLMISVEEGVASMTIDTLGVQDAIEASTFAFDGKSYLIYKVKKTVPARIWVTGRGVIRLVKRPALGG